MITDDMPISVGNLKALIPQIVARGGAFAEGYWRGSIPDLSFDVRNGYDPGGVTVEIASSDIIESSRGRVYKSGTNLVFTDAGRYAITASFSFTQTNAYFKSLGLRILFGENAELSASGALPNASNTISGEIVTETSNFIAPIQIISSVKWDGSGTWRTTIDLDISDIQITRIE